MFENLKSDRESKNEAMRAEYARLETKRDSTINTESNKLEANRLDSTRDYKNNDEVRFDSNGNEIVYEVKHRLNLWDYLLFNHNAFFRYYDGVWWYRSFFTQ